MRSPLKTLSLHETLSHRYLALAIGLTCVVWIGLALAMYPFKGVGTNAVSNQDGLMTSSENLAVDLLFQLREARQKDARARTLSEPITLIAIDDRAVAASGIRPQKWPRDYYARLIDLANEGGANVIGVDLHLSEKGGASDVDLKGDQDLVTAIGKAEKVVLSKTLSVGRHTGLQPRPEFAEVAIDSGFVEVPADKDGFVRSLPLFIPRDSAQTEFSFATVLAERYLESLDGRPHELKTTDQNGAPAPKDVVYLDGRVLRLRDDLNLQLDWRSRSPAFQQVSAADLLFENRVQIPSEVFRNRIVLIGETYLSAQDMYQTPLFELPALARRFNSSLEAGPVSTSGLEVHATAIATILFGRSPTRLSYLGRVLFLLLPISLTALIVFRLRALLGIAAISCVAVLTLLTSAWLFNSHAIILPLASAWLGMALLTPIGLSLRYGHERVLREGSEKDRALMTAILERCVGPEVAEEMWKRGDQISLINERRIVTVVFTDIRQFTTLTESADSDAVVEWLNDYFNRMHETVLAHGGHINKFIGDGLMIIFGAPIPRPDKEAARSAVDCGLAMLAEVKALNQTWQGSNRPVIEIGVGIHTGDATCGVVGAERRLEYTVIGDTVNLASRIESETKSIKIPLLISESTASLLGDEYELRPLGEVQVKGKMKSTALLGVLGKKSEVPIAQSVDVINQVSGKT